MVNGVQRYSGYLRQDKQKMTTKTTKLILTTHIVFSAGWFGTVAVFIALAISSVNSQNPGSIYGALLAMQITSFYVIVPFCLAALITGIILAISTKWGLVKYYWIVAKLFLTVFSTILLIMHLKPISMLAEMATIKKGMIMDMHMEQLRIIFDAAAGLMVLAAIIAISVYKPWGKTTYGITGRLRGDAVNAEASGKVKWLYALLGGAFLAIFILIHIFKGVMHTH